MLIHNLPRMFEVLLQMQMGQDRQGQIVISNMQSERKRTSDRQTQRDQMREKICRVRYVHRENEGRPENYGQRETKKRDDISANDTLHMRA